MPGLQSLGLTVHCVLLEDNTTDTGSLGATHAANVGRVVFQ